MKWGYHFKSGVKLNSMNNKKALERIK